MALGIVLSQSVALQNFAITAQTFTVLAPSENRYHGQRGARMLSGYCWTMKRDVSNAKHRRKSTTLTF